MAQIIIHRPFTLITTGSKFIAQDRDSGGYPYEVDDVLRAHQFPSPVDAARYKRAVNTDARIINSTIITVQKIVLDYVVAEEAYDNLVAYEKELAELNKKYGRS